MRNSSSCAENMHVGKAGTFLAARESCGKVLWIGSLLRQKVLGGFPAR